MADLTLPLSLTASFEEPTEAEEDAEHGHHYGWAVVRLNAGPEVAKIRLGYYDLFDGSPREALEEAVASWLGSCRGS